MLTALLLFESFLFKAAGFCGCLMISTTCSCSGSGGTAKLSKAEKFLVAD